MFQFGLRFVYSLFDCFPFSVFGLSDYGLWTPPFAVVSDPSVSFPLCLATAYVHGRCSSSIFHICFRVLCFVSSFPDRSLCCCLPPFVLIPLILHTFCYSAAHLICLPSAFEVRPSRNAHTAYTVNSRTFRPLMPSYLSSFTVPSRSSTLELCSFLYDLSHFPTFVVP